MFKAMLALCAAAVVFPQSTQDRPDLARDLTQIAKVAFEAADARRLYVVVMLRDETFVSLTLGSDKSTAFEASLDGGLHAVFAGLAMQLYDQGELDLEARVGKVLPELGPTLGKITAHQLLTHTAALHDWQEFDAAKPAERLTRLAALGTLAEPGTCFQPSTGDTFALGMLLQRVTHGSVIDLAEQEIFARCGASGVGLCAKRSSVPGLATALGEREICGCAADLAGFMHALSARKLTSERSWVAMTTGDLLGDGCRTRFGHGLDLAQLAGHERLAFGGNGGGARLQVAYYPAFEMTIAVIASGQSDGKPLEVEVLERSLARAVYSVSAPQIRDIPLEQSQAERYCGEYLIGCDRVQLLQQDKHLVLVLLRREPLTLLQQGDGEFIAEQDHDLAVHFEAGGKRASSFLLVERGWQTRAKRID